ncbi:hypothetical protein AOR01nite_23530 [Acetobacter orleanensis]|uniref:Uncharacterized protein n=2 Tax=Acetobacter orleanensis TaxID=104099 RepID=A0A4Y3TNF6_9PROT|nr:hypothetical protein Abol_015_149 [Acetobacter orleanensis JCM 7639]GEB83876.1 hypothetical protein AOR01nite_23530 [Acetobacter orleanensis]
MQQRVSGAARLVIAGHTIRHCSMAMGVKYGTLSSGVCIAKIRELVTAYQVETGSAKSLAALASSVDVPLVRRLGMKMLANPASILGQNITAIAALSLQGLPVQDIATLFGIKLRTLKKSYLSKSRRICAEYDKVKNPNPEPEKAENTAVYALPRLNGALNAEHEVSMSALWRGLERWRSVA